MAEILVIKLGALGDFVQALGPFAAIRRHHKDDRITLLSTAPYAGIAEATGYFDDIWIDEKPRRFQLLRWMKLRRKLRKGGFARVYDLQTSERSSIYYFLFQPEPTPEWSGIARGCSHPHANPGRDDMHTFERQAEQLAMAGIEDVSPPDLSWARGDLAAFDLPARYALVVPGGAAHRPDKRWPAAYFSGLARWLATQGTTPVLLGNEAEKPLCGEIYESCPEAINLAGKTALAELAVLAQGAELAVGNDTGPMHLIAAAGCRSVVLYSKASNPVLCGQRGADVEIIRRDDLNELSVEEVTVTLMGKQPS